MVQETNNAKPSSTTAVADDDVLLHDQQLKRIEDEQKSTPLVGEKQSFFALVGNYDPDTSPAFFAKANELAETYSHIRFIRGDGNCYYRAILVGLVESMLTDKEKLRKFIVTCKEWIERLLKLGFPDWTCTDFCEYFIEFLQNVLDGKKTEEDVFITLNDDSMANYLLMFFRLITSGYLKEHADEYQPFIGQDIPIAQYCETEIEAMWKDADHLAVMACVRAANSRLRIEYMDRNEAPNGGYHHNLPDGADDAVFVPDLTLLYRPGHYDLIYKK